MEYQIKLFSKMNKELKEVWSNFEKDSCHPCFNSLIWIENYITSFGDGEYHNKLRVFIIFFQNQPVCIFPFEIINKFKINLLQWACNPKSDFNAPLQKKNFSFDKKSFKDIWNNILKMIPEVDIIYLKNQIDFFGTSNNPFINYLQNSQEGSIDQILLPKKWEDYTSQVLKKKFYQDFLRTKRLIKKKGKVEFIIAKKSEEKEKIIEILINQKKLQLTKNNIDSFNTKDINFYKNFEKYKNNQFVTQVSAIKLNGELVAAHWGIVGKNYFYYLLPAMPDGDIKKFAPGKLLLSLLIRWSIAKKLQFFDFGLGEETYKKNWSNQKSNIYNHISCKWEFATRNIMVIITNCFQLFLKIETPMRRSIY